MKRRFGIIVGYALALGGLWAQETPKFDPAEAAAMLKRVEKFTKPGEHHKLLEKWLGEWEMEISLVMGGRLSPGEKGVAKSEWLMEGRWLKTTMDGTMMGRPYNAVVIMGYDNFKKSYVVTTVSGVDTAMIRMEGDLDPSGKSLLLYGTLDEYLTGEHDKMVKTVWRFVSDDEMRLEIHDLPIGEKNTKVVEFHFKRKEEK